MKPLVPFRQVARAVEAARLPEVDHVVGIGRGGTVPASLVAYRLGCDLTIWPISFRDDDNRPMHEAPRAEETPAIPPGVRRILLVDDVSVSGATLEAARSRLEGYEVTTLVLKGRADIVLHPELATCVHWPWHPAESGARGGPDTPESAGRP